MVGTPELVATIRVDKEQSTTNYDDLHRQSRQSRERLLRIRGAFSRLRASARTRPSNAGYWKAMGQWT